MNIKIPIEIIVLSVTVILGIIGGIISITLSIISNITNKFQTSLDNNTQAVQEIKTWMAERDTADKYESGECATKHTYIQNKFKNIDSKMNDLDKRLTIVERK